MLNKEEIQKIEKSGPVVSECQTFITYGEQTIYIKDMSKLKSYIKTKTL